MRFNKLNDSAAMYYEELYKSQCKILKEQGYSLKELNNYQRFKDLMDEEVFKSIIRSKHNRQQKRNRTKTRFKELYILKDSIRKESNIVFGTITLDDKHLSLKEDTYIRKIRKWLEEHFLYVILNKDFGSKKGREHYHFIGLTTEPLEEIKTSENKPKKSKKGYKIYELVKKNYNLGFEPTLCIVDLEKNDFDKTTNYLLKLNNHSTKSTARSRVRIVKSPLMRLFELRPIK